MFVLEVLIRIKNVELYYSERFVKEISIECVVLEVTIYEEEMRLRDLKRRQKKSFG